MTGEAVTDAYAYGEAVCGQVGRRFGRTTSACGLLKPQDLFGLRSGCAPRGRDVHRLAKVVRSPFSYRSSTASPFNGHIIETSASPKARAEPPGDTICSWTLTFRRRSGIQPPWPMAVPRLGPGDTAPCQTCFTPRCRWSLFAGVRGDRRYPAAHVSGCSRNGRPGCGGSPGSWTGRRICEWGQCRERRLPVSGSMTFG